MDDNLGYPRYKMQCSICVNYMKKNDVPTEHKKNFPNGVCKGQFDVNKIERCTHFVEIAD